MSVLARVDDHPLDQPAQALKGVIAQCRLGQRLVLPLHLPPVDLRHIQVKPDRRWRINHEGLLQAAFRASSSSRRCRRPEVR
jgi:hypothetical protein